MAAAVAGPRRGRPRDESVDRAVIAAALELVAEGGLASLTMESVAVRAGVGKTTVYRRWPGRDELVRDALATLNDDLPPATGDTTRERLVSLLTGMAAMKQQPLSLRLFPRLMSHKRSDPAAYRCFYDRVLQPRRERFLRELRAGVQRGDIRKDVDLEGAVSLLVGPVLYQHNVLPDDDPAASLTPRTVVDLGLSGIGADAGCGPSKETWPVQPRTPRASR
jgi:AcrR family transcriptional regulator